MALIPFGEAFEGLKGSQTRGIRRVELLLIALRPDDAHAELLFRLSQLYKKQEEGTWNVSNSQIPT
jgi:hypothetical protein